MNLLKLLKTALKNVRRTFSRRAFFFDKLSRKNSPFLRGSLSARLLRKNLHSFPIPPFVPNGPSLFSFFLFFLFLMKESKMDSVELFWLHVEFMMRNLTRTWKNAPRVQNLPAFMSTSPESPCLYVKPSRCASDRRSLVENLIVDQ